MNLLLNIFWILLYTVVLLLQKGDVFGEETRGSNSEYDIDKNQEKGNLIPLNQLKHIFDDFNCSDSMTKCEVLLPKDVPAFLRHNVTDVIKGLCVIIKPVKGIEFPKVDLRPLQNLTSLKRFQITTEQAVTKHRPIMLFPTILKPSLELEELHMTLPIPQFKLKKYIQFIKKLKALKVLNFRHSFALNVGNLSNIIQSLEGKPIVALSLKAFQDGSNPNFIPTLNLTDLLWPLRHCPLQYVDLSRNALAHILPGFIGVTKSLRILDVSENNILGGASVLPFAELLISHPSLQVLKINDQGCIHSSKQDSQIGETLQKKKKEICCYACEHFGVIQ